MTPARYQKITSVLNKRQPDLTVIADQVHKGRNIAAIVRTCDAVGIDTIHAVKPEAGYQPYRGTALGSQKWVEVELYEQVDQPIANLQGQGFQVIAANLTDHAVDYDQVDYCRPTALLLGTEKYGVSSEALAYVDTQIYIPMLGMVGSFNVSAACAIILAEARRQRQAAGLYDHPRLTESVYQKRLFCWAYPELASYCHQHQLDYPELDSNGDLLDGPLWYQRVKDRLANNE